MLIGARQAKAGLFHSIVRHCAVWPRRQPRPEKPNALANEPNPPRVTPVELDSEPPDDERADEESPLKKLLRDHEPPDELPPPPDEDPRGWHAAPDGAAIPGWFGWQFSRGISAKAPPPSATVPINSSATWLERLTGSAAGIGAGLRLPNSLTGRSAMISRSSRRR